MNWIFNEAYNYDIMDMRFFSYMNPVIMLHVKRNIGKM